MKESKRDRIPDEFKTIEEAAMFWETHSLADYKNLQTDTDFEVQIKSEKNYFAVDKELSANIDKLAQIKGVLPETLVNLWLQEKLLDANKSLKI